MKRRGPSFRERFARRVWLFLMTGSWKERLYLPPYPRLLGQQHLKHCRTCCDRDELISQLDLPPRPRVAEIGVFQGEFSRVLLDRLTPGELHLVDLDLKQHAIAAKFAVEVEQGCVHLHEADSSTTIASFPDSYFDMIYIDGDHSYEGVKMDIEASVPRLADGGYLVFNDYTYWSPCENMAYGIIQAVNEFCWEHAWEATHFALDGYMYCDIALRKPNRNSPATGA
jgi:SAM-dependent methyltransferase